MGVKTKKFNKSAGEISRVILVLAGAVLLITIIVFLAIRIAGSKKSDTQNGNPVVENEPPKPVYETIIGDIKFILQSSIDLGGVLKSNTTYQQDLTTTEKFIRVTVGAQNKGKVETTTFGWELGNIIDSDGRNFIPITNKAFYFLPQPDLCGSVLKPEFTPIPCVRIYEVSKKSDGLKIQVINKASKQAPLLLDLKLD